MTADVFISYSSRDALIATAICKALEEAGHPCWIAPRNILPGQTWTEAIIDGINASQVMVLLYSAASNASPQVLREIERAVSKGLGLIAFRAEDVPLSKAMEYLISVSHWHDATTGPLEFHLDKLVESVKALLAVRGVVSEPMLPRSAEPAPTAPPPAQPQHNLPVSLTSFVGRARELTEIKEQLTSARLLTLLGAGGSGKTRLALQAASEVLPDYPDGVWLVELAALSDPNLLAQEVADVLKVKEQPGQSLLQTLTEALANRKLLLILDNCEHLLAGCAQFADRLLRQCRGIAMLATSREGLNISGEHLYRVQALEVPDLTALPPLEELGQTAAVRLFVERATAARPGFALTAENAVGVVRICRQLDGLPLALELAAARVRALPIEQLEVRLNDRFRLLTGGSRTALPHQQTLRALIDWSYDLLQESEQALLCRCSVFSGGWTLEAAEQVCAGAASSAPDNGRTIEDWEVLDLMTALSDKSLAIYEETGGVARYHMLETIRQYAVERLAGHPGGADVWSRQHRDYYLQLAEQGHPHITGPEPAHWLERFESENDNFRQALSALHEDAQGAEDELRLVRALQPFWMARGYLTEGRSLSEQALNRPEASARTIIRADACDGAGTLANMQGDYTEAVRRFTEGLEIRREQENREGVARSLNNLGQVSAHLGDHETARRNYEESLELHKALGNRDGIANLLQDLGVLAFYQGDHEAAERSFKEALALRRAAGETNLIRLLTNLGVIAENRGDYEAARRSYEEGLRQAREVKDRFAINVQLYQMGNLTHLLGEHEQAIQFLEESLALSRDLGDRYGTALALQGLGRARQALQEYDLAGQLLRDALHMLWEIGERRDVASAFAHLASLLRCQGADEQAVRLWAAADSLRQTLGIRLAAVFQEQLDQTLADLRARMGERDFVRSWEQGQIMTPEEAVAYALN
jgi:non-specific serine/threonine protein kinase